MKKLKNVQAYDAREASASFRGPHRIVRVGREKTQFRRDQLAGRGIAELTEKAGDLSGIRLRCRSNVFRQWVHKVRAQSSVSVFGHILSPARVLALVAKRLPENQPKSTPGEQTQP